MPLSFLAGRRPDPLPFTPRPFPFILVHLSLRLAPIQPLSRLPNDLLVDLFLVELLVESVKVEIAFNSLRKGLIYHPTHLHAFKTGSSRAVFAELASYATNLSAYIFLAQKEKCFTGRFFAELASYTNSSMCRIVYKSRSLGTRLPVHE